ncbi:MAG: DUF3717 domain-containing protein [Candidatus Hodarchaeales archaeon]|jgi:hypothetical protein
MYKLTDEQIEKAVNWWAERLQQPTFDAGADSKEMAMAEVMANMLTTHATEEEIENFKIHLGNALRSDDYNPYHGLHVDYHPDRILSEVAEASNINPNNFPWKTSMWFDEETVKVSLGYGAKVEEL